MANANKVVALGFGVAAFLSWFFPSFNGIFTGPADISIGEGHITGAILAVGAAILWFMRMPEK